MGGRIKNVSPRMREILALVFEGKTNKQIAKQLNIGRKIVENYIAWAKKIIGGTTRTSLVYNALRQGILQVPPDGVLGVTVRSVETSVNRRSLYERAKDEKGNIGVR